MCGYAEAPESVRQYVEAFFPDMDQLAAQYQGEQELAEQVRYTADQLRQTFTHLDDATLAAIAVYISSYAAIQALQPVNFYGTAQQALVRMSVGHGLLGWELSKIMREQA